MQHLQSADCRTGMVSNIWPELHHAVCTITLSSGYIMVIITTITTIIITSIIIIPFSYLISFIFILSPPPLPIITIIPIIIIISFTTIITNSNIMVTHVASQTHNPTCTEGNRPRGHDTFIPQKDKDGL